MVTGLKQLELLNIFKMCFSIINTLHAIKCFAPHNKNYRSLIFFRK